MKQLDQAINILKSGGVVVYPTDTSYGLAVDATNVKAVKKLYSLKGRDFKKPIHVIPTSKATIKNIVRIDRSTTLLYKLMPGPLTIVLPLKAKGKSWQMLSAGMKTLGIRLPNNNLALELVKKFGRPITTTSANKSFGINCYSVAEVRKEFAKSRLKPDFY